MGHLKQFVDTGESAVYESGGHGKEQGVNAVEDAAVARDEITAVLDMHRTLDKGFYQVAPRAEYHYDNR